MIALRPLLFIFIPSVLLMACTGEKEQTVKTNPLDDLDTLYVGKGAELNIDRYRIYQNKNALFKLGKMKMKLTIDDLQTGVHTSYPIDSGMLVYNKEYFTAQCYINTQQVKTLQVDSSGKLQLETPAYLENNEKKHILLEYKGNFYPKERMPSASCSLTINDSTGLLTNAETRVTMKKKIINALHTDAYVDGLKWKLYTPVKDHEIKKDSIRLQFQIHFEKQVKQKNNVDKPANNH